jgi:hypothetical protein
MLGKVEGDPEDIIVGWWVGRTVVRISALHNICNDSGYLFRRKLVTCRMVVDVMVACVLDRRCDDFELCLRCQRTGTGFGNAKLAESPVIEA